jgi:transcriptional regulator with XRE-family HTH domain
MTSSLTQIVASGIRAEMARQGKTQQQLASLAGMAQQTLSRRIKVEDPIPFDTDEIDRVAQALGIPVQQLLVTPATASAA